MCHWSRPNESILERLHAHAQAQPEEIAYRFLHEDGETDALSFGQLEQRVRGLAGRLREYADPGDRALLLYPQGLESIAGFLACLAAGVIAVPAYPPCRNRKAQRLRAIAEDAQPRLILTSREILPTIQSQELEPLRRLPRLATDAIEIDTHARGPLPKVAEDAVAFLQYTSGSTQTPRGVMVTHANLAANERAIQAVLAHTPDSVCVSWLPAFHDMGLIGNILHALFVGFPCVLLAPRTFLREPVRWLQAITRFQATLSGGPNFAYDHCVRKITQEQKRQLDLRSWKHAFNGAEPIRPDTLDRFAAAFASCGFRREAFFPCYGLAEATLFVCGGPAGQEPHRRCIEPASWPEITRTASRPSNGTAPAASDRRQRELANLVHAAVLTWLRAEIDPAADVLDRDAPLTTFGLDSIGAATVAAAVSQATGSKVHPEDLMKYPTIHRLAAFLVEAASAEHRNGSAAVSVPRATTARCNGHGAARQSAVAVAPCCTANGKARRHALRPEGSMRSSGLLDGAEGLGRPHSVIRDTSTLRMAFNILPGLPVEEVLHLREYRIWHRYAEGEFNRTYLSQMTASPDHLIFLTALAHAQKLAYVCLAREFGVEYQPGAAERFKIWPTRVQVGIPELITRSEGLIQKLWITRLVRRDERHWDTTMRTVVGSLAIEADAVIIVLGGGT